MEMAVGDAAMANKGSGNGFTAATGYNGEEATRRCV